MSVRELNPGTNISQTYLPPYATPEQVNISPNLLPFTVYTDEEEFLSGCAEQVAYVYRSIGSVVNVDLNIHDVFAHYQRAVMMYSYLINQHQAKNVLASALGTPTGNFDSEGNIIDGGNVEPGSHMELKYPKVSLNLADRYTSMVAHYSMVGGNEPVYRARFEIEPSVAEYDLQAIIYEQSTTDTTLDYFGKIQGNERIYITQVWYIPPIAQWRFYGLWGMGMNIMGNLSSYGMWADDSTFQIVPVWQNRLQAMAYKEAMNVRVSHYSYEIKNNKLRLYPVPGSGSPPYMWVEFRLATHPFEEDENNPDTGLNGVNNINNIPFENIPYRSINSMGKQWIRDYALALSKICLGHIRGKLTGGVPFVGNTVALDGASMVQEGKEELRKLEDDFRKLLEEITYPNLLKSQADAMNSVHDLKTNFPLPIIMM